MKNKLKGISDPKELIFKRNADLFVFILLQECPRYGLNILEEMTLRFGVYIPKGSLYPMLHDMYNDGFLDCKNNGMGTKEYSLTELGKERIERYFLAFSEFYDIITSPCDGIGTKKEKELENVVEVIKCEVYRLKSENHGMAGNTLSIKQISEITNLSLTKVGKILKEIIKNDCELNIERISKNNFKIEVE